MKKVFLTVTLVAYAASSHTMSITQKQGAFAAGAVGGIAATLWIAHTIKCTQHTINQSHKAIFDKKNSNLQQINALASTLSSRHGSTSTITLSYVTVSNDCFLTITVRKESSSPVFYQYSSSIQEQDQVITFKNEHNPNKETDTLPSISNES